MTRPIRLADESPWASFSALARKYDVDTRTIIRAVEEHPDEVTVLWFTPKCARVNADEFDAVLRKPKREAV